MSTPTRAQETDCTMLMETAFAFCRSQCLFTAVELDIFTLLDRQPLRAGELCSRLGISDRVTCDFLDALVGLSLLQRQGDTYSNTPLSAEYLVKHRDSYIGGFFSFMASRLYAVWKYLPDALHSGLPQNEARTEADYYANLGADTARHERFLKGMAGLSVRPADLIAHFFPWQRYRSFVDIGGAVGLVAVHLARAHPHLEAHVFDLPTVQPFFENFTANNPYQVTFHSGDFFEDNVPSADVYILGHVLHNWNIEEKRQLLTRLFESLNRGGAIIAYEWFLDENRSRLLGLLDSLTMRLVTRTGGSVTENTCLDLFSTAGFSVAEVIAREGPYTLIVGWKR